MQMQPVTTEIISIANQLPTDQQSLLLDFARFLRQRVTSPATATRQPDTKRGSASAVLNMLNTSGGLEFEAGELDQLLDEIETMRVSEIDHA